MKKIFVSQSELDLSRNRHQRRLEAKLDAQIEILPKGIMFCEYINLCNKPCFKKEDDYCGVRRFYEKYPNYPNK